MLKRISAFTILLMLTVAVSSVAAQYTCYAHDIVDVERATVIWDQPGFSGRVVYGAAPGSRTRVLDSKYESGKCWAQVVVGTAHVDLGWLQTDTLTVENLSPGVVEVSKDDPTFAKRIEEGLDRLGKKAPHWYEFVTHLQYTIKPCGPCPNGRSTARWSEDLSGRRVYIHENTFVSPMRLARALVHESTHIHQGYQDRWTRCGAPKEAIVRLEKEAVARETEMVYDIDPHDSELEELKSKWAQPESWWLGFVQNDCPWPNQFSFGIGPP